MDTELGNYQESPFLKQGRELVNSESKWETCCGQLMGTTTQGGYRWSEPKRVTLAGMMC